MKQVVKFGADEVGGGGWVSGPITQCLRYFGPRFAPRCAKLAQ